MFFQSKSACFDSFTVVGFLSNFAWSFENLLRIILSIFSFREYITVSLLQKETTSVIFFGCQLVKLPAITGTFGDSFASLATSYTNG